MVECLNCKIQFQEKRSTAKFCSNKCRAAFSRKKKEVGQESIFSKMVAFQDELSGTLLKIKQLVANTPYDAPKLPKNFIGDEPLHPANLNPVLSYNELRGLIEAATSGTELHKAWKEVEKNKELVSWQLRELGKLKELQRTKIDF
jgi:hypothetical protein